MTVESLVLSLLLLLVGLVAGWLMRARMAAPVEAERKTLADRLGTLEDMRNAALRDLAVAASRAEETDLLRGKLDETDRARDEAERMLAAVQADHKARMEGFEAQIRALGEAREQLSAQFSETAGKLLNEAQRMLIERADQRFHQAHEKSEASLKALLQPVETTLKRYEEGLGKVEKERVDSYAALREAVEQVRLGSAEARVETARLVNALRSSPKARGRWGEQQLRNVLEMAGLSQFADFRSEVSVDTADGRLRPDVIVRLPGGRQLIIDAKCSLNAYLEAVDAVDEVVRAGHLKAHAGAIRNHAQQLGAKDYWTRFGDAADYVVMFIPGEHFLAAALEQDDGLWEWAFEKRVLLATPTNLVAIARTVASVWRQEKMAEQTQQIAALGKEMYERLAVAAGHLSSLGRSLNGSVSSYNKFVSSFENRVLVTGRRFKDLSVETGSREIDAIEPVEALGRLPAPAPGESAPQEADAMAEERVTGRAD
ncbi:MULTISPECIES: DNA recombination protein RmuC [unclassified Sphingobium]|uniref:DNA recombination protein RmuC n=1 Tax=unclassified Sphingobium TaxID=2611147 RepID=UPI002225B0F6|nr:MULTISPECIES: DNA recombination protein RmuC [unclassified Sphingobium]MCW2381665.1 DNA recombination protein RmuC [Sphingobium sp. B2D3B]MCW2398228.1 DNA recombination protein RmuC [Sphingobium sp. B2D3C]